MGTAGKGTAPKTVLKNPWVRFLGLLIVIVLALRVFYAIRGILIPFSLALVAAYIFDPVVDWLETRRIGRMRIRRGLAVSLLLLVLVGVAALFVFFAVPHAVQSLTDLLSDENLEDVIQFLPENVRNVVEQLRAAAPEERKQIINGLLGDLFESRRAASAVGESARAVAYTTFSALMWVFNFFLFFVVTIYLLLDIDRVRGHVKDALPLRYKDEILRVTTRLDVNLKAFFRGQCVVVMVLACIFTIGLGLVGCPFWYIIGITGGVGAFIPYFALASGMVPAIILSAAKYGDVWHPLAAAAVFALGLIVDNVFVTPNVIGKRVGMHPVVIILSILVFGVLFGFLGVIFVVPIAAVVKVLAEELFARYRRSELYTGPTEGSA